MHSHEIQAVHDAIHEARVVRPEIAGDHGVKASAFADAMAFIPDEHHARIADAEGRFVASVVSNARAAGRSPYTVALFALDIA